MKVFSSRVAAFAACAISAVAFAGAAAAQTTGVAGVTVQVYTHQVNSNASSGGIPSITLAPPTAPVLVASDVTNGHGRAVFILPAGNYRVRADHGDKVVTLPQRPNRQKSRLSVTLSGAPPTYTVKTVVTAAP